MTLCLGASVDALGPRPWAWNWLLCQGDMGLGRVGGQELPAVTVPPRVHMAMVSACHLLPGVALLVGQLESAVVLPESCGRLFPVGGCCPRGVLSWVCRGDSQSWQGSEFPPLCLAR